MSNPSKPTIKTELFPLLVLAITALSSVYFYSHFPDIVPTHWNIHGEIDGWSSKKLGAFLIPAILMIMYLMFLWLPYIDPKKEKYDQFRKVYHIFKSLIIGMMSLIYFMASFNGLGYNIEMGFWVPFLIGVLFIALGNYFGKLKPNWFVGIKTPWTLSSEENWNKTHRFGGKIFIFSGLIMMATPLFPTFLQSWLFAINMILLLGGTIGYSFIFFLREKNHKTEK